MPLSFISAPTPFSLNAQYFITHHTIFYCLILFSHAPFTLLKTFSNNHRQNHEARSCKGTIITTWDLDNDDEKRTTKKVYKHNPILVEVMSPRFPSQNVLVANGTQL